MFEEDMIGASFKAIVSRKLYGWMEYICTSCSFTHIYYTYIRIYIHIHIHKNIFTHTHVHFNSFFFFNIDLIEASVSMFDEQADMFPEILIS